MLSALSDSAGKPVDWWFMYKLPEDIAYQSGSSKTTKTTGFEYLYYDSESSGHLSLSPHVLSASDGALYKTLDLLFSGASGDEKDAIGWILYNDEIPGQSDNDEVKGHTKGVLGFHATDGSAIWLLHSTPRFPLPGQADFPEDEKIYGQTFLCITLKDLDTADAIARQMRYHQDPQTYACRIPPSLDKGRYLYQLAQGGVDPNTDEISELTFSSKGGQSFSSIAKNRLWGKDFWIDLIAPLLGVDLNIESWRRGAIPGHEDKTFVHPGDVEDAQYINLKSLGVDCEWKYTKDHSKWGVSIEEAFKWVCVADINRQVSQEKRGGASICFEHPGLWESLSGIDEVKP